MVAALPFLTLPAQAGSVTASSIWDKSNAIERARQQLPASASGHYRSVIGADPADRSGRRCQGHQGKYQLH